MNELTQEKARVVNADVEPRFKVGDAVVHPIRGAGRVVGFKEFETQGTPKQYYEIKLLKQTDTSLMIPVGEAEEVGMRRALSPADLDRVWAVLQETPQELPSNYRSRHKIINDKLQTGDVFQIAEAVRDAGWRHRTEDGLTQKGRDLYKRGLRLLAAEIAVSKGISLSKAQRELKARLQECFKEISTSTSEESS
ncbi:MAG: CarD family transcriptional regulator [Anaerolineae bacterium]